MTFTTTYNNEIVKIDAGYTSGSTNIELNSIKFEDGLKVGNFAKLDTGSIDNLDGSATPVIAGVVLADKGSAIEDNLTLTVKYTSTVTYIRSGLVTVNVKAGETPAQFGAVYADNATGNATATNTDIATNAEFVNEVKTGVWLIRLK